MPNPLQGKHIILGVTGSIAAYKAADLASKLAQAGAVVDVILTQSAQQFVTPLTFQSVTGRRAFVDADLWGSEGHVQHIALGRQADLVLIAPVTANTIARLAHGIADNLLCVTALAANCPLAIAPAMDGHMFTHPATQANLQTLRARGVSILGPTQGHLASGLVGVGRMLEPQEILGEVRRILSRSGFLAGRTILVTAGGTEEPIDPVRTITNRSSGKQGYALAQAALDQGAEVVLVSGPTSLSAPIGAERINVRTAREMMAAVLEKLPEAHALLMAAAVADFRPAKPVVQKIKKENALEAIHLEVNPDILAQISQLRSKHHYPDVVVGFAAESQDLLENASRKMKAKQLDLIVANDISASDAGFEVDTNRVVFISADKPPEALPLMSKAEVAERVIERVTDLLGKKPIVHITTQEDYQIALAQGKYEPASLQKEGFIHCSRPAQVIQVANRFYSGAENLVLLWIIPERLASALRWETADGQVFPHIYGALNLEAVTAVTRLTPEPGGEFLHMPHPAAESE